MPELRRFYCFTPNLSILRSPSAGVEATDEDRDHSQYRAGLRLSRGRPGLFQWHGKPIATDLNPLLKKNRL